MNSESSLENLPNLGPKSVEWLRDAGIKTASELEQIGPVAAFLAVKTRRPDCSLNLLYALYGGLHNVHWAKLTPSVKQQLQRDAGLL